MVRRPSLTMVVVIVSVCVLTGRVTSIVWVSRCVIARSVDMIVSVLVTKELWVFTKSVIVKTRVTDDTTEVV